MAKVKLTEDRLNAIIRESIYEVIKESQEDEGLGRFLGNAYQWAKNKYNNFQRDFTAGRHNQMYANRNYDEYAPFGNNSDAIRNFGQDEYNNYRNQTDTDRTSAAANSWQTQNGSTVNGSRGNGGMNNATAETPTQGGAQPQQGTQQPAQGGAQPQQGGTQPQQNTQQPVQRRNRVDSRQAAQKNVNAQKQQDAKFLMQKGFTLKNGQWLYMKDGSNSNALESQYPDIKAAAQRYNKTNSQLGSMRESKMNAIINEAVRKSIKRTLSNL